MRYSLEHKAQNHEANMLIGRDAGSTRMASTSALRSDEALLRSDAKMEKAK